MIGEWQERTRSIVLIGPSALMLTSRARRFRSSGRGSNAYNGDLPLNRRNFNTQSRGPNGLSKDAQSSKIVRGLIPFLCYFLSNDSQALSPRQRGTAPCCRQRGTAPRDHAQGRGATTGFRKNRVIEGEEPFDHQGASAKI